MRTFEKFALTLVIIGAINWGLIGFFSFDLVAAIFGGQGAPLARLVYSLVGLSGLVCFSLLFRDWDEERRHDKAPMGHQRKLNYGTEFGEEEEFTTLDKFLEEENNKH
ncbi:hypothetical protein GCM10012290_01080 [Halolactibacillus alkaliphilus]|uniref:DUF378 domain-containing protein n=1 Tax=Halolactibacillus alkaliphilus TaxID=442899 RepID=A0A511WX88_9BACI|nr:DUF378 domain-containing protein [Halolactibacillus alkaliphilus]GEN55567.1 hypothetical protein HAL01_00310 [Halolactibacillus alkaliphilus]GGN63979.1 hypothetical protein GCM10012290_01080 [Halolactibacillus alkaliphilus]SFO62078.1 hypothetical protein SAMN05720591_101126 [Halolactibacillus alkaliphilus]